jgi:hypothetical protein
MKQVALLDYVRSLIPDGVPEGVKVVIVGDSEFESLIAKVDDWDWAYALRMRGSVLAKIGSHWHSLSSLVDSVGQSSWFENVLITSKYQVKGNVMIEWKNGEDQPWLIATNLVSKRHTLMAYGRRMWIEEMFGDFKGHGFDLESSHLCHFARLSRLTLAVCLLYVWLVTTGSRVIKNGLRHLLDRRDRRDLSIFRIGLNMVERRIANNQNIQIHMVPYF